MTENTLQTVIWSYVAIIGIVSFAAYSLTRFVITKRGMFERREDSEPASVHRLGR